MAILKKFNGRNAGGTGHISIGAYSQKQAAELLAKFTGYERGAIGEIRNYFSHCWGNSMDGIELTEPCLYHQERWDSQPVRKL